NPFNPEVTIEFSTTDYAKNTEINIYNIKGQRVRTLVDAVLPVGEHTVIWQGDDDKDKQVGSGVYLVRMKAGDKYVAQRKVTVVK
ncbi:MAG: FlgD immunoglobulin-like domain containing protein, partial [Candidatus Stygibacter australis]|nr:FlgD immunoglobulin-like domain containing protein [Candidatus Stygibacter australis]